jgi:hypothetical protein
VARALHDYGAVRVLLPMLTLAGCVIPPSLSVDNGDAGVNSPPAILSVRSDQQELTEPGPATFGLGQQSILNLTLLDTDVTDTLYVRVFVGYKDQVFGQNDATAPRSTCIAAAAKTAQRSATCDLTGVCLMEDVGQTRSLTIVVFDREVQDTGTPLYQAMAPGSGGLSTSRFYYLKCQPPSS